MGQNILTNFPQGYTPEEVGNRLAYRFMEKYKISNMKSETNQVMLRIISHEKPVENAMRVEASLEDVFLYYFGEKAGDENATL